jgi:hypothetical protein
MDAMNNGAGISGDDLRDGHPRLDQAESLLHRPAPDENGNGAKG